MAEPGKFVPHKAYRPADRDPLLSIALRHDAPVRSRWRGWSGAKLDLYQRVPALGRAAGRIRKNRHEQRLDFVRSRRSAGHDPKMGGRGR